MSTSKAARGSEWLELGRVALESETPAAVLGGLYGWCAGCSERGVAATMAPAAEATMPGLNTVSVISVPGPEPDKDPELDGV